MPRKQRECKFCGIKFEPGCGAQKFCSNTCRIKYNNASRRPKKLGANKILSIAEVNARAREMGMHYGDYVAEFCK